MADQLTDAEWEHLASVMGNPKVQQYLQQTFAAQKEGIPEGAIEEEDAPKPKKQSKPKTRTRTNGASYHTQAEIEEPEESAANTAGTYQVPQKKTRVSAAIRRKQQYLEACANKDASVNKQIERDGKTLSRKKGYKEWYREQYGPGYDGKKFTIKDAKVAPRKVFQSTIVKEAYKLVQDNPQLKGRNGNTLRLKIMSGAMKNFEDVYKDVNFFNYIQDPQACSDMINDFAMELQDQINKLGAK